MNRPSNLLPWTLARQCVLLGCGNNRHRSLWIVGVGLRLSLSLYRTCTCTGKRKDSASGPFASSEVGLRLSLFPRPESFTKCSSAHQPHCLTHRHQRQLTPPAIRTSHPSRRQTMRQQIITQLLFVLLASSSSVWSVSAQDVVTITWDPPSKDTFDQIGDALDPFRRRSRKLQSCDFNIPFCCNKCKWFPPFSCWPYSPDCEGWHPNCCSQRRLEEEEETGSHLGEVRSLEGDINPRCKHLEDEVMERALSGNYTFAGWEAVLGAKVECDLETVVRPVPAPVPVPVPVAARVQAPVPVAAPVHPGSLSLDDYKASRGCCNGWNKNKEKNAEDEWKEYEKE